jgi:hypothetical protein
MRKKPFRKGNRLIEFLVIKVFVFIKQTFPFPRLVNSAIAGLNEGKRCREKRPLPDPDSALMSSAKNSASLSKSKLQNFAAWVGAGLADLVRQIAIVLFAAG